MVDARCDAVGSEERPFLGSFQKGGGARNGTERRAEPRSIKGGHARGAPSSLLGSCTRLGCSLRALCLSSKRLALPSLSLVPVLVARRGLLVETRTGGAAVRPVVDLRIWKRGAGEGSPAAWEVGTRRDHANGRGRRTRRPLKGGVPFLLFCMTAVAPCPEVELSISACK